MYREDFERTGTPDRNGEDVFSKPVRAGKRTYFFDVKATKGNNDFYLTITESKRKQERDGSFSTSTRFSCTRRISTSSRRVWPKSSDTSSRTA